MDRGIRGQGATPLNVLQRHQLESLPYSFLVYFCVFGVFSCLLCYFVVHMHWLYNCYFCTLATATCQGLQLLQPRCYAKSQQIHAICWANKNLSAIWDASSKRQYCGCSADVAFCSVHAWWLIENTRALSENMVMPQKHVSLHELCMFLNCPY